MRIASYEIDKIVQSKFFHRDDLFYHEFLCILFRGTEYESRFNKFWKQINTRNYYVMSDYLDANHYWDQESALLRLLIVEDFKRYCDLLGKKK